MWNHNTNVIEQVLCYIKQINRSVIFKLFAVSVLPVFECWQVELCCSAEAKPVRVDRVPQIFHRCNETG